jgi:hypothetical protein
MLCVFKGYGYIMVLRGVVMLSEFKGCGYVKGI